MAASRCRVFITLLTLALSACGGGGGTIGATVPPVPTTAPASSGPPKHAADVIKHVVVIVQENRSFDNLFHGFPGADTASSGPASDGSIIPLKPTSLTAGPDPSHDYAAFVSSFNGGRMNGFDLVGDFPKNVPLFSYAYVPQAEVQPYFDMAHAYALADRMFQSNNSASYGAHQYLIAAQSADATNVPNGMPWGCDAPTGSTVPVLKPDGTMGPGVTPCFDYQTVGDSLDAAGVTWAYYAPSVVASPTDPAGAIWSAYDAVRHIRYGPDWAQNQIAPETTVLNDIRNGSLRGVSIVVPDGFNSDHARFPTTTGPLWVSSIVQAVGASKYWKDTAIFVVWDDWGGWYDHVVPPARFDQNGPGFRVPLIAISPYAKHGYVSHVTYETASITRYIEEVFNLRSLGQRDATATPPDDMFDYNQQLSPLTGIRASASALRAATMRAPSHLAPDDD
ncbi:MAG TPA: alkaline phosphatase family protein [Candidatus Elarobacter sp.]|jgi:phospholipase C